MYKNVIYLLSFQGLAAKMKEDLLCYALYSLPTTIKDNKGVTIGRCIL